MTDNMQRARELLAAEYEKHARPFTARTILSNPERVGEDFNRALRAIAAALRSAQVPEWRPIETAPKDELILVGPTKRMGICVAMHHSRDGWVTETTNEWFGIYTPTHWKPLPAAPTVSAEGGR